MSDVKVGGWGWASGRAGCPTGRGIPEDDRGEGVELAGQLLVAIRTARVAHGQPARRRCVRVGVVTDRYLRPMDTAVDGPVDSNALVDLQHHPAVHRIDEVHLARTPVGDLEGGALPA